MSTRVTLIGLLGALGLTLCLARPSHAQALPRETGAVYGRVVIDGSENRSINEVSAFDIGAMEFYRQGEPAPMLYDRGCGAIVIWTKR